MKVIQNLKRKIKTTEINNNSKIQLNAAEELAIYEEIYELEVISMCQRVTEEFFRYCESKNNFVLLVMYNNEGKVYLKQSGGDQFCLPGGEVKEEETILDSVRRIVGGIKESISINEVEPLALVKNYFVHKEKPVIHTGIVMMVRVNIKDLDSISKRFFEINERIISNVNVFSNKRILQCYVRRFNDIITQNNGEFQDEEIEVNKNYKMRYKFHNLVMKRLVLTPRLKKSEQLKEIMKKKTKNCSNLIDISCGDNSLLFSLLENKEIKYMVANDISWSQIELISKKSKVIFTNHNAITFPFRENAFDFVYCSNTLHHIPNEENLRNLLESLFRVGKKIVIYEIEDPEVTRGLPYILNKYWYRGFLKDVGEQYLCFEQFREFITEAYKGKAKIKFEVFKNIQGNYMIAEIEKI